MAAKVEKNKKNIKFSPPIGHLYFADTSDKHPKIAPKKEEKTLKSSESPF
jgi:hypothetical protein